MELVALILYSVATRNILFLVFAIFLLIAGVKIVRTIRRGLMQRLEHSDDGYSQGVNIPQIIVRAVCGGALISIVGLLILAIANMVSPHFVDGMLFNSIGQRGDAIVTKVSATNSRHNNSTIMRHDVVIKSADGANVDTYFETWDFNTYPAANTVRYPQQGQQFRVLYLPSFPTSFLILTDEDSPYSKQIDCSKLGNELNAAAVKLKFDPKNAKYQLDFEEATKQMVDAKCATVTNDVNIR